MTPAPEGKDREGLASQEPPCIHTVATGKHEYNVIAYQHFPGARIWIPHCQTCGWVDTEAIIKKEAP